MTTPNATVRALAPPPFLKLLLKLPWELRKNIYYRAMRPGELISQCQPLNLSAADFRHSGNPFCLEWLEEFCRTDEATRIDVSSILLQTARLYIFSPVEVERFSLFLESFPEADNQGFAAVRDLNSQLFGCHRPSARNDNAYTEFMKRCTELRQVQLKFEVEYMTIDSCTWAENLKQPPTTLWSSDQTRIRRLEDIILMYRLTELLKLEKLNRLTVEAWPRIRVSDRQAMQDVLVDCTPLIESLVQWLERGFAAQDRDVTVSYVEASSPGLRWSRRM